jgi:hypothetical protein
MTHRLLLLVSLFVTGVGFAQLSSSPLGMYGIGEPGILADPLFGGLGNASVAVIDSTVVNFSNPSSYTALTKGQPLFSIGLSGRVSMYDDGATTSRGAYMNLNQLGMVIPVNRIIGIAFGLQPFSRRGYSIYDNGTGDSDISYNYAGSGSTNYVFGGIAFKLINQRRSTLSLGANIGGVFGSVKNTRYAYTTDAYGYAGEGGAEETTYRLHSAYYSFGLNYGAVLDQEGNHRLTVGASFTPEQRLSANRDYYFFYSDSAAFNPNSYTILDSELDDKGNIVFPSSASIGFNYQFRPLGNMELKRKSVYQLNVVGEFTTSGWSSYATDFREEQLSGTLSNTQRFSLGVQFTPNYNAFDKTVGQSYLRRIRYRIGGYAATTPYTIDGRQLTENAVTLGFGLPFAGQRTNSSINLSFQYGNRGNGNAGTLSENFYGFNVGVVIAPARYDTWFVKRKLD